ncbi:hypothetical protein [Bdellovibrio reynosensis]|uniref:Alginate export domain-containing protein n=1 Tax=Bdellovibrio reynosensis TaxID=2835041 RepID=A0ABY4CBM3_9BACT|nr:hypothetical protein [Bdellovibrio reynosensis]UOF00913.1 hypothetical protein MNR06_14520 [Bdellovibrio reynosensis]
MFKKNLVKVLGLALTVFASSAQAMTLDWTGGYRFEWTEVDRPTLGTPGERKAYGLNSLYLSPKIIAADGVNVVSRFDLLTNTSYEGSQLGEIWGLNNHTTGSKAVSNNQGTTSIQTSHLYLNVNQEYGALIVGRAPFEFGLGLTYSAGKGAFDHWYDSRDMVAYKIVVGDWFFMPVLSRKQSGSGFGQGKTISSTGFQLQYESEENKSTIGVFQENIRGAQSALDYSADQITAYGGVGAVATSDLNIQRTNFVLGRGFDSFGFKVEAGFQTGETGISNGTEDISVNGYGIAAEFYIPKLESKWDWSLKAGMATGDDAESTEFGGYAFNKNYDVAMLMFNHRLGQHDFLNTNVGRSNSNLTVGNSADDESISNAIYIAPSANYVWNERFDVRNTLVYGQLLNSVKNSVDSTKDLGLEWDIELIYKPSEKIQWVNQLGLLFPGSAWKNGAEGLGSDFTYGFASKAAISF